MLGIGFHGLAIGNLCQMDDENLGSAGWAITEFGSFIFFLFAYVWTQINWKVFCEHREGQ